MASTLILINPWIIDFAAYDLWSRPLGLLGLAGILRHQGYDVRLIDCLDIHHPGMVPGGGAVSPVRRAYGTGKFRRTEIRPPEPLASIQRPYSRYGISEDVFVQALESVPRPSAVLVTSHMTYWYPGVQEAISLVRRVHPRVPVLLGGIYARLCRSHAIQHSGADLVVDLKDDADPGTVPGLLQGMGIPRPVKPVTPPPSFPAFDLLGRRDAICVMTSTGCPFRCGYCAGPFLHPCFHQRPVTAVLEEIGYWRDRIDLRDVAFYDDALLVNAERHLHPLMEALSEQAPELRFHTPNALHIREITETTARMLHRTGFRTIRLGLETTDHGLRKGMDCKVNEGDFERAVDRLRSAGYGRRDIGVYVMMGLPGQSVDSVEQTIREVDQAGAVPFLAEYSPIPHTLLWKLALETSSWDLREPLFQNNTLIPCWDQEKRAQSSGLRALANGVRRPRRGEDGFPEEA